MDVFGQNCYIVSNSRREWDIDWVDQKLSQKITQQKAFQKIVTKYKKPLNSVELSQVLQEKSDFLFKWEETCIVGDRIMTDVLLGKITGALTVLVDKFDESEITPDLIFLRNLEVKLAKKNNFD